MHRTGARLAAAALACLASGCASGPAGPPGGGPGGQEGGPGHVQLQEAKVARPVALLFVGMDIDHNLIVTEDELNKGIDTEFARADQDKSGVITGFEMMDWGKAVLGDGEALPDLREMDTDMNYTVTPQEFATALRHAFQRMDVNGDGALTRAEMLFDIPNMHMGAPGGEVGGGRQRGRGEGRRRGGGGTPGGSGGGSPPF